MRIALENARIAFIEALWVAATNPKIADSPRVYSCRFVIEPGSDNDKKLREAFQQAAREKFKSRADYVLEEIKYNKNRNCYMPGDRYRTADGQVYNGFEGKMSLSARRGINDGPPMVLHNDNSPLAQAAGVLYSGCYVDALVEPFAYTKSSDGVSCGLLTVRFRAKGEAFGGAGQPTADGLPPLDSGFDDDEPF